MASQGQVLVRWTAAMLLVSAALFAVAFLVENARPHQEVAGTDQLERGISTEAVANAEGLSEAGDTVEVQASPTDNDGGEVGQHADESMAGINLENPWIEWGFVVASVVVALAVLVWGQPALIAAAVLAGVAALLDIREVAPQIGRADVLVGVLVLVVALAHVVVVILAILAWRTSRAAART